MCRWLAYSGAPLLLEDVIIKPDHSLIDQSLEARLGPNTTNGDGFGVGWYAERDTPGLYKNVLPAWNDTNLRDLAAHIRSPLFLAHIRAATGTAVQYSNCHPFRHRNWVFVHNGEINGFGPIRRRLMNTLPNDLYAEIRGTTDSELMFFLSLALGLETAPHASLELMAGLVEQLAAEEGNDNALQMTLGVSDGQRVYAVRYASRGQPRTLFHSKSVKALHELNPDYKEFSDDAVAVVSEPLNDLTDHWEEIPESTLVEVHQGNVVCKPFVPRRPGSKQP